MKSQSGGLFSTVMFANPASYLIEYHTLSVHRSAPEPDQFSSRKMKSRTQRKLDASDRDRSVARISLSVE